MVSGGNGLEEVTEVIIGNRIAMLIRMFQTKVQRLTIFMITVLVSIILKRISLLLRMILRTA